MNYTKSLVSLALIASVFALTACGETAPATTGPATAAPVEKQPEVKKADPAKSSRGNFIAKVGGTASFSDGLIDKETAKVTVTKIAKGTCTEPYAQPAENGNFLFLSVNIQTTPALSEASYPKFDLNAGNFKFIAKNGTTFNGMLSTGPSFGCLAQDKTLPMAGLGPDEKVTGVIVLDVPQPSGTLVMKNALSGGNAGYEFTF